MTTNSKQADDLLIILGPHNICNFNCPYCFNIAGKKRNTYTMFDNHDTSSWIMRLHALNRNIHFLFSGIGEPVLLERFRSFIHELYDRKWVASILIFTNGSRVDLIKEFATCSDKIQFHASYHPTQIPERIFIDNINKIDQMNLLSHISTVAYKYTPLELILRKAFNYAMDADKEFAYREHKFSQENVLAIKESLGPLQSKLTIQGIDAIIPSFSAIDKEIIMQTRLPEERPFLFREAASIPHGVACNCGKNLIICDHNGDLWRCSQYINSIRRLSTRQSSYGNLFAGPRLDTKAVACYQRRCSIARQEYAMRNDNNLYVDKFSTIISQGTWNESVNK